MNPPIILLVRFNVQAPHEPLIRFANRETAHCNLVVERSKANRVILVLCLTAPCTVGRMQYSHCLGWVSCILRSSGHACIAFKFSLVYFCGGGAALLGLICRIAQASVSSFFLFWNLYVMSVQLFFEDGSRSTIRWFVFGSSRPPWSFSYGPIFK